LTHDVGIQALGYVMESLTEGHEAEALPEIGIEDHRSVLSEVTAWSGETWDLGPEDQRRWNGLQNTPNDVKLLTNVLIRALSA
jgi:hypothetical protein